jgi:hypothetical protein
MKPVAWTSQDVLDADHIIKAVVRRKQDEQHTIPLYTHPAKPLTDEEIKKIATEHIRMTLGGERFGYIEFAKAILRKAQEK